MTNRQRLRLKLEQQSSSVITSRLTDQMFDSFLASCLNVLSNDAAPWPQASLLPQSQGISSLLYTLLLSDSLFVFLTYTG